MIKVIWTAGLLFSGTVAFAQLNPVSWSFEARPTTDGAYEIQITASCDKGWYIYSQYLESEDGPIATVFEFSTGPAIELLGKTEESGNKKTGYDEMFGMNITKYADKAVFLQRIRTSGDISSISGTVTYMSCNDEKCLPPRDVPFQVTLP